MEPYIFNVPNLPDSSESSDLRKNVIKVLKYANAFSPATSITLPELRDLYHTLTKERFPRMGDVNAEVIYLLSLPVVAAFSNKYGTKCFYLTEDP